MCTAMCCCNAMMPVLTFLGMMIAETLAGSIVVEQVFGLPGIGRLLISSVSTRDFPVVEIFDSVYYLCCDFCIFSGRHSVSGSGSQNQ